MDNQTFPHKPQSYFHPYDRNSKSNYWRITTIVLLLILLLISGFYFFNSQSQKPIVTSSQQTASLQNLQLTNPTKQPVISPTDQIPIIAVEKESAFCDQSDYTKEYSKFRILSNQVPVGSITIANCDASTKVRLMAIKNNRAYLAASPGGMGGYILYALYNELYELNLTNNAIIKLHDWDYLTDIGVSADSSLLAYSLSDPRNPLKIMVRNLNNAIETPHIFSQISSDAQIGDFKFSPNNEKLAIAVGYGPADERGEVYILNLKSSMFSLYEKTKTPPRIKEWIDNDQINWE